MNVLIFLFFSVPLFRYIGIPVLRNSDIPEYRKIFIEAPFASDHFRAR